MNDPERYQQPEDDQYPRLGRLLIALIGVAAAVGVATWAAITFMGDGLN